MQNLSPDVVSEAPVGGAYSASADPLAGLKGAYF